MLDVGSIVERAAPPRYSRVSGVGDDRCHEVLADDLAKGFEEDVIAKIFYSILPCNYTH